MSFIGRVLLPTVSTSVFVSGYLVVVVRPHVRRSVRGLLCWWGQGGLELVRRPASFAQTTSVLPGIACAVWYVWA